MRRESGPGKQGQELKLAVNEKGSRTDGVQF